VLLGKVSFAWLSSMVEDLFCEAEVAEFFKLSREESFIVQRHSNRSGCFSVLEVYGVAVIDAPLLCPREKKAGVDFYVAELGKAVAIFDHSHGSFIWGLILISLLMACKLSEWVTLLHLLRVRCYR
jgi:hypothetical protein